MTGRVLRRIRGVTGRIRSRYSRRPLILLYHRIGEAACDPWLLAVSRRHFEEHLEILRRLATPIALGEVGASGLQPFRPVAITFDDCYGETLRTARTLLEAAGMKATAFAPTESLSKRREFWWDELERLLLDARSSCVVELSIEGTAVRWELDADTRGNAEWRAWEPPQTLRQAAYVGLYYRLLPLRTEVRDSILDELRRQLGAVETARSAYLPMPAAELAEYDRSDAITVGAHTRSHALLAALSSGEQRAEIEGSKRDLEDLLGREVDSFAYPYGNVTHYSKETVGLVRQAGFTRACSNFRGLAAGDAAPFELPRWSMPDCGGGEFERMLASAWSQ